MSPARKSNNNSTPRPSDLGEATHIDLGKTRPQLGKRVALYQKKVFTRSSRWFFWLTLIIGSALILAWTYQVLTGILPVLPFDPYIENVYLWSGSAILLFAILWLLSRWSHSRPYLAIYQNGLVYRESLHKTRQLLWSEIAGIAVSVDQARFLGIRGAIHYSAKIFPKHQPVLILTEKFPKLAEALSRIKAGLYKRLYSALQADWSTGQWLTFGPLAIHQSGIGFIKKSKEALPDHLIPPVTIPWADVQKATIQSGYLSITYLEKNHVRHKEFPVSTIPNIEILLQFIQQVEQS